MAPKTNGKAPKKAGKAEKNISKRDKQTKRKRKESYAIYIFKNLRSNILKVVVNRENCDQKVNNHSSVFLSINSIFVQWKLMWHNKCVIRVE